MGESFYMWMPPEINSLRPWAWRCHHG